MLIGFLFFLFKTCSLDNEIANKVEVAQKALDRKMLDVYTLPCINQMTAPTKLSYVQIFHI